MTKVIRLTSRFLICGWLFCILTSERVLRMPFAGWNQFFDGKTTFSFNNGIFAFFKNFMMKIDEKYIVFWRLLIILDWSLNRFIKSWIEGLLLLLLMLLLLLLLLLLLDILLLDTCRENSKFCVKKLFWPANCVWSTHLLVEIHNSWLGEF